MDCGIHDIDMSRWLLGVDGKCLPSSGGPHNGLKGRGQGQEVKRVFATGLTVRHPELAEQEDCDNALGIIEYTNGSSCTLHLSRTGMAGYESTVEVFGMEQKLVVEVRNSSIEMISIRTTDSNLGCRLQLRATSKSVTVKVEELNLREFNHDPPINLPSNAFLRRD